jgi:hypothetical protein
MMLLMLLNGPAGYWPEVLLLPLSALLKHKHRVLVSERKLVGQF